MMPGSLKEWRHILSDEELTTALLRIFTEVLGRDVDVYADLYQQGVDSIACVQVRKLVQTKLLSPDIPPLPLNVVYDCGTVSALGNRISELHGGITGDKADAPEWDLRQMSELSREYSTDLDPPGRRKDERSGHIVVLTGSTGMLGAHMLHYLMQDPQVRQVICLVRARSLSVIRGDPAGRR
jgi:hypothetical protein